MKNNTTPLVTIVVPIYNVEKYLRRCVDSVIGQTYSNLEVVLVNDGSTDSCPDICDSFAKRDRRIKVIHKENGGLSDARNVAIDIATGQYILCVDSDDFIAKDTVGWLVNLAITNNSEIATCSFVNYYTDDRVEFANTSDLKPVMLKSEEALGLMLYQKGVTTSAWGKLYKTSLFGKDIRYPKGKLCEDLDTTYKLFSKANKVTIGYDKKFYYQQRHDSIINSEFSPRRAEALQFAINQAEYINSHHPKLERAARNRLFMEAVYIIIQIKDKAKYSSEYSGALKIIVESRKVVLLDSSSRVIFRLYALSSYLGIRILASAYNTKAILAYNYKKRSTL